MGQRANMVLVRGGVRTLFYDHWAANRLDVELFWGPQTAEAFFRQREPADDSYWLDDVWCEGAALLDWDRRRLLFFGGEDVCYEVASRRALIALMSEVWDGWTVEWACEGLCDIGRALGLPPAMFLAKPEPKAGFAINRAFPVDNDFMITFAERGAVLATSLGGSANQLAAGPEGLLPFRKRAKARPVVRTEPAAGGVHVDLEARRLWFWSARAAPAAPQRVAAAWPGWQVHWLGDRYEDHLDLARGALVLPEAPLAERRRQWLDHLRDHVHTEGRNPAREMPPGLKVTDLNPATDIFRSSAGDVDAKLALLDALAAKSAP